MNTVTFFYNCIDTAKAVERYLEFVHGLKDILSMPLYDPYSREKIYKAGLHSGLIMVEVFAGDKPDGFRFAREMGKKVLLIFYTGEIEIEPSGAFWLVLPDKLEELFQKMNKILLSLQPVEQDYEELERRFPILKGGNNHHGNHC
jgi:hypothetical protein